VPAGFGPCLLGAEQIQDGLHGRAAAVVCASLQFTTMIAFSRSCVALTLLGHSVTASRAFTKRNETESYATNLLHESMNWLDMYYDNERGYLFSLNSAALVHETRASAWYAAGLLARNEADDAEQAVRIVNNIIGGQFKNESLQW
jgi:hypothetical protein